MTRFEPGNKPANAWPRGLSGNVSGRKRGNLNLQTAALKALLQATIDYCADSEAGQAAYQQWLEKQWAENPTVVIKLVDRFIPQESFRVTSDGRGLLAEMTVSKLREIAGLHEDGTHAPQDAIDITPEVEAS